MFCVIKYHHLLRMDFYIGSWDAKVDLRMILFAQVAGCKIPDCATGAPRKDIRPIGRERGRSAAEATNGQTATLFGFQKVRSFCGWKWIWARGLEAWDRPSSNKTSAHPFKQLKCWIVLWSIYLYTSIYYDVYLKKERKRKFKCGYLWTTLNSLNSRELKAIESARFGMNIRSFKTCFEEQGKGRL
jgi:hypothetical protein